jgi:hypothetical protein
MAGNAFSLAAYSSQQPATPPAQPGFPKISQEKSQMVSAGDERETPGRKSQLCKVLDNGIFGGASASLHPLQIKQKQLVVFTKKKMIQVKILVVHPRTM